ncbi:MAG: HEAT repeat domain-containing protein [Phycisphaerales bacterium]
MNTHRLSILAAASLVSLAGHTSAQSTGLAMPMPGAGARTQGALWVQPPLDPSDPRMAEIRAANGRRAAAEKELRRIRVKHFGQMRRTEIRQAGITKLREFKDPAVFPVLLSLFDREGPDVRTAVLDHLMDQATPQGDATLAWAAVFDKDPTYRRQAAERVGKRAKATGEVPGPVQAVVAEGLRRDDSAVLAGAANLANVLKLFDAIPLMVAAQVRNPAAGQSTDPVGDLAYIYVGTQRTFVADLMPVVGESSVAFDPQVEVLSEGTVLRVIDAFVFEYSGDVHGSLVELSKAGWGGQETAQMGWDAKKWMAWYDGEFLPHRQRLADEEYRRLTTAKPGPDADSAKGTQPPMSGVKEPPSASPR